MANNASHFFSTISLVNVFIPYSISLQNKKKKIDKIDNIYHDL